MTNLNLYKEKAQDLTVDALVLAVGKTEDEAAVYGSSLPTEIIEKINLALPSLGMTGKLDSVASTIAPEGVAAKIIVLAGIGKTEKLTADTLRRASGAASRSAHADTVAFDIAADGDHFSAVVEGAALGAYHYDTYISEAAKKISTISFPASSGTESALQTAQIKVEAVTLARDLVNTPALDLYPEKFVEIAKEAAADLPLEVQVWDMEKLKAEGCGGIVGVGQGSSRPPFMVKLSYHPENAKSHIALIGKGITFDSGGISLKLGLNMENMKGDMGGAATVLGATIAAARLGVNTGITTYLAIAENLPSANAQRPSDIVKIRNGKTVEIVNTDAEGRLVMADALSLAAELHPDEIIDVATLTGAQLVALGTRTAGVMGQGETPEAILSASQNTGEPMWVMPIPEEMTEANSSDFADIKNSGGRYGGMLVAANFLSNFVEDIPWAHIDIAGPAFNTTSPWGFTPKGGTGMAVRTLIEFLASRATA